MDFYNPQSEMNASVAAVEQALGVSFENKQLLAEALVHTSYVNERPELDLASNERLEFLGDAVLGSVVAHLLFDRYREASEGDLTVLRAALVRQSRLAKWARAIGLGDHLLLGRGEEQGGGRTRDALLARAFEAVVGAAYLDRGYPGAAEIVGRFVVDEPELLGSGKPALDAKSRLQQLSQAKLETMPTYEVIEMLGPGHRPTFTVEVSVGPELRARGTGPSKQAAQQAAAEAALEKLEAEGWQ